MTFIRTTNEDVTQSCCKSLCLEQPDTEIEKTKEVTKAMEEKNWDMAVQLRGRSFMRNLETFRMLSKNIPKNLLDENGRNLAVINVGAPCCGVNAAG